ncbi:MAG TPA: SAM-dependent methyltransferase [Polyangiales bacterium]|nr:SAM-dependent methyltransferase [Polyangiales bacterium]
MASSVWQKRLAALGMTISCACASGGTPPAATAANEPHEQPPTAAKPEASPAPSPEPSAPLIPPVDPATAPQATALDVANPIKAIVDAKDRTEDDRALDAGRHPGELLTFFGVKPGMKVAELFAGGGYTAELLARAVGKQGKVYAQNNKLVLERFAEGPWSERLKRPQLKNVVRVDRELDDPLPPEAKNLDIVFSVLIYHDSVWLGTDRDKMNAAVFAALKPGGVYAVVDHSGRSTTGTSEAQTFHRIEESVVRSEIEKAGFELAAEASFLRNPQDTRDWNDSPKAAAERRGTSDRFVLKFVKPK